MRIDPYGNAWWNLTSWNWDKIDSVAKDVGLVLAAVGAVVLVTAAVTLTAGAAAYVILGAAAQTTISGVMIGATVGGALAGTINIVGQASKIGSMDNFNFGSLMIDTFSGAAFGAICGFGGAGASLGTKIGVGIAKIVLSALTTGLHGINDGKSASQIWGDVGRSALFSLGTQALFIGGGAMFSGGSSGIISKIMNNQLLVSSGIIIGTSIYNNWIK